MSASGRFLLDTNIVIALLEGDDDVSSKLNLAPEVFVSAVVLGELVFGAAKSAGPWKTSPKSSDLRLAGPFFRVISTSRACMAV